MNDLLQSFLTLEAKLRKNYGAVADFDIELKDLMVQVMIVVQRQAEADEKHIANYGQVVELPKAEFKPMEVPGTERSPENVTASTKNPSG